MPASTRDRALDAALASFAARGFEATSLDDVAGEVGVSKQAVLYYYPSKAALLDAVVDGIVHIDQRKLVAYAGGYSEFERLRAERLLRDRALSAYSTVIGMATEVEVLRGLGEEPTLRSLARRRRELLEFLHSALAAPVPAVVS